MNIFLGAIGFPALLLLAILYVIAIIYSLTLVFKSEKGVSAFLWAMFVIFVPVIGAFVFNLKYFVAKDARQSATN